MGMLNYRINDCLRNNSTIAQFGDVTEDNDRIAIIHLRPGFREGQRGALTLRRWGQGACTRADGQPWFFDAREQAIEVAECWINTGRTL